MVLGGTSEEAEHGCSPSDEPQGDAGEGFHTWGELGLGYQGDQETTSGISLSVEPKVSHPQWVLWRRRKPIRSHCLSTHAYVMRTQSLYFRNNDYSHSLCPHMCTLRTIL